MEVTGLCGAVGTAARCGKLLLVVDPLLGYVGQASVLPGEPVQLYVSTTSREFRVRALRMGWYGGDLARRVWESGPVRGHRQRAARLDGPTRTVHADWGESLTVPTD